jgi:hypothetical protein
VINTRAAVRAALELLRAKGRRRSA